MKWIWLLVLFLALVGCKPLSPIGASAGGEKATVQPLSTPDMIPAHWGHMVAVTEQGTNDFSLWFEDEAGNIRMIGYNRTVQQLWSHSTLIRRRTGGSSDDAAIQHD
jgi:hypothetical protein